MREDGLAALSPRDLARRAGTTTPTGFEPSADSFTTGLVDQQISKEPGGDRWVRLIDDFVSMFLAYCQPTKRAQRRKKKEPT